MHIIEPGAVSSDFVANAGIDPTFRIQTSEWARDFVAAKLSDLDGSRVTSLTAGWVGL